ncbi:MAG: 2-oxoglutarate dehydrogenase E1 component [Chloroflexota bacterium]|nr:2-oxoglutarate dehydrogenase E1 component [Chloroflexota bacterium]
MTDLSAFYGPNAGYVLDLYDQYLANPAAVEPELRAFFTDFTPPNLNGTTTVLPASAPAKPGVDIKAVVGAASLAEAIRDWGHLAAQLDPLGSPPIGAPELDPGFHGLTEDTLAALPVEAIPTDVSANAANAAEVIRNLRHIYGGQIGYDFDQVQIAAERAWLREAVEHGRFNQPLSTEQKHRLLKRLTEVEGFERFLHQTYAGQKRFSVEGTDILVPMLDVIIRDSATAGVREVVIGMAHRGRLNVMAHVFEKPYAAILAAFEGGKGKATAATDTSSDNGITGDVKYHLGAKRAQTADGKVIEVPLVLAPNPSHLEFVNPVVEGMTRASQDDRSQPGPPTRDAQASLAILLHGDSAFPGQGIVAETLNLSGLPGYTTGGTIHIIVNNQIGFTTDVRDARSTLYAGDLAKGFEIPVVHVNADDPEACLTAVRIATAYRAEFGKDFLIDLIGYRRWGHNEGLEPTFTQPQMYATIATHPTVRQLWLDRMVADGLLSAEDGKRQLSALLSKLGDIRRSVTEGAAEPSSQHTDSAHGKRREVPTAVPEPTLRELHGAIHDVPEGFRLSPKLLRQWDRRRDILDQTDGKIDWAHAETLAFAAILSDGIPIRLTGQDSETGTFSQRHFVLHNAEQVARHVPLASLPTAKASFAVYNSPLSEAAAVGFEYGYSVHAPETLVLWEAQFGDFVNGAQVLIDQFIVAARAKWQQDPALVLLLPHGYEGQGPEHSSGRLERFLQLAAEDNLRVANVTTAAQYFHLLRRQAALLKIDRHALILMTPKSLLRHPLAASPPADFTSGTFQPVLDDPLRAGDPAAVTRLVLCSGKIGVELEGNESRPDERVAVARVEQLAPFQTTALTSVINRYPNLREVYWVQEEPKNMGAWTFMEPRLRSLLSRLERPMPIHYLGRPERASPAEGSAEHHANEQARIIAVAFARVGDEATNTALIGVGANTSNGASATNGRARAAKPAASSKSRR